MFQLFRAVKTLFIFTAADAVPCGDFKRHPVQYYSVDYIFWSIGFILNYFENRTLLNPVLGA